MQKIKIFQRMVNYIDELSETVNFFIENKDIVSIKHTITSAESSKHVYIVVLIVYTEK